MLYRDLGKTGLSVSVITFGCGPTGGGVLSGTSKDQEKLIGRALELGINVFDTAAIYGQGQSEQNLGSALTKLKAEPIIASKVALEIHDLTDIQQSVITSVESSLKRLKVESIDLIQLHNRVGKERAGRANIGVGAQLTVEDVLGHNGVIDAFATLRKQGKVKATGFTGFGGTASEVYKLIDSGQFDTINVLFNLLNRSAFTEYDAPHSSEDTENNDFQGVGFRSAASEMGVLGIRVLAAGNLINFSQTKGSDLTKFKKIKLRQVLNRIPSTRESELPISSIRFALSNPGISSQVIGLSNISQIETAILALEQGIFSENEYSSILNSDI